MRKTKVMKLMILISFSFTLFLSSCESQLDNIEEETFAQMSNQSIDLSNAVYNETVGYWMVPQKDPYTLENFQKAYDNLSSGNSKQTLIAETDVFAGNEMLKATHYALKIYPKNDKELEEIEMIEDIKISYIPLDYAQLPESQVKNATKLTRSQANTFQEKSPYTVTYDDYVTDEGPVEPETLTMPIIYAVWPCEKKLPEKLQYEISYEVFLPNTAIKSRSTSLNELSMETLENEAISLVFDNIDMSTNAKRMDWHNLGVSQFDNVLNKNVYMVNLIVRVQLGSNITDSEVTGLFGQASFWTSLPSNATVSLRYIHPWWKLTNMSNTPYTLSIGTVQSVWGSERSASYTVSDGNEQYNTIWRGMREFYIGGSISAQWKLDGGIDIRVDPNANGNTLGSFNYSNRNAPYIIVHNGSRNNGVIIGTITHEMGHFMHFAQLGYDTFRGMHSLLKESYSGFNGWFVTNDYYDREGYDINPAYDITGNARQSWTPSSTSVYTPLLVDLYDDYNQGYINDDIKVNDRESLIYKIYTQGTDWNSFKNILRDYSGSYYTLDQINSYISYYDTWFSNN